jgi:predicted dienelactone hydrolase
VEALDIVLHDARRNKDLSVVACFPMQAVGPLPVIVFSHGAGASGRMVTALPRYWASHGYVVLCPTHADSASLSQEREKKGEDGVGGNGLRGVIGASLSDPKAWKDRASDVSFLLDSLSELGQKVPGLAGKIDPERVGVGGHSLELTRPSSWEGRRSSCRVRRRLAVLPTTGPGPSSCCRGRGPVSRA